VRPLALALAALALAPALAGCAGSADPRGDLVPYPRMHDAATYALRGAQVDLARWENGHALEGGDARLKLSVLPGGAALDGARIPHATFLVREDLEVAGGAVHHADLYVSPAHEAVVQSFYPLSGDQSIVAFDERGYPWLFGASALFGESLAPGDRIPVTIPDNLGHGAALNLSWRVGGAETVDGVRATRLDLDGSPSLGATLWMEPGSPWPVAASLTLRDAGVEPLLRADGSYPAHVEAHRVLVERGDQALPPRDRAEAFAADAALARAPWDGFAPPDGPEAYEPYLLGDAIRDAKLVDNGLAAWLKGAQDPRLYRATFKLFDGPAQGTENATWLLEFVDRTESYYQVQMERLEPANGTLPAPPAALPPGAPPLGVPRATQSGPAQAPASENHGWFAADAVPGQMVTLSQGIDVVRAVFGAKGVQIFLRSFEDPPGYAYYLDGGWDGPQGRYTVVYDPERAFLQEATGHGVTPRLAGP
jgi:hypothetical protein